MSRLSRQEIKRDEVLEGLSRGVVLARKHQWRIIGGAILVVALILVWVGYLGWQSRRDAVANDVLAAAIRTEEAAIGSPSVDGGETFASEAARDQRARELFGEVATDYGSTEAGAIASLYLARYALDDGDAARARELWRTFTASGEQHMLAATIWLNLVELDRSEGRGAEVATDLEARLEGGKGPLPIDAMLYQLGVTYEDLGRPQDAAKTWKRLFEEFPQSPWTARARQAGFSA